MLRAKLHAPATHEAQGASSSRIAAGGGKTPSGAFAAASAAGGGASVATTVSSYRGARYTSVFACCSVAPERRG